MSFERHPDAPVALRQVGEALALGVEHAARAGIPQSLETGVVRQVGHGVVVETDDLADIDRANP